MLLYGIYLLAEDPAIFAVNEGFLPRLLPRLSAIQPILFVFPSHTREPWRFVVKAWLRNRHYRKDRFCWMCCSPKECRRLAAFGFQTRLCHQNLFVDEHTFTVQDRKKQWDAVYTSQLYKLKRVHLAAKVASLRIITAGAASLSGQVMPAPSYDKARLLATLGVGHAAANDRFLNKSEVAAALNECRCGLALSKREGGMLACTEYLLCGLPVVTTPSIGGREAWYNDYNHVLCAPDTEAVSEAVKHLVAEGRDPAVIRDAAVERCRHYRNVLASEIAAVGAQVPFDPRTVGGDWFANRFVSVHFLDEFLASHQGGRFGRVDLLGKHA